MKLTKQILALISSLSLISSFSNATVSLAEDMVIECNVTSNEIEPATGLICERLSELSDFYDYKITDGSISNFKSTLSTINTSSLPSSFDITTNPSTCVYFPPIGNQGSIGSCSAWSTTYYQFTYETNKLKHEVTNQNNIYSPAFTFNYVNLGINKGAKLSNIYEILKKQGSMHLSDYPHPTTESEYSFDWSTDVDKLRDALQYRVSSTYGVLVNKQSLSGIDRVKEQLASGKVAVISTHSSGWTIKSNSDREKVIVRGSDYGDGNHAMAVVGYDDDFQITLDGVTFTGAFKLANSWGVDAFNHNNGYIWVLYDALCENSSMGTAWQENMLGIRKPVFITASNYNTNDFTFINISKCDVYFTEEIRFTSKLPWGLQFYGSNQSSPTPSNSNLKRRSYAPAYELSDPSTRFLVFDYTDAGTQLNLDNYLSSQWSMSMYGNHEYLSTYDIGARLTDNLGNDISPFNHVYYLMIDGYYQKKHNYNIRKGRVSVYDNNDINIEDAQAVQNYLANIINFSSLQLYLADYNNDGNVDIMDAVSMRQHIAEQNNMTYSIYDTFPGEECSLAEFIEEKLDISVEEYIAAHREALDAMNVFYEEESI